MRKSGKILVALISLSAVGVLARGAGKKADHTGFLKNYAQLKSDPQVDDALRYVNPRVNLKAYNKFIVDPIE